MRQTHTTNVRNLDMLHQLAEMLERSLARYLSYASPWTQRRYSLFMAILRKLAAEHQHAADEIARLLESRRQSVSHPAFPAEFTYYNDVSWEYLAPKLLRQQRFLIGVAKAAHSALASDDEVNQVLTKILHGLRKFGGVLEDLTTHQRMHGLARTHHACSHGILPDPHGRNSVGVEPQTAA